MHFEHGQFKLQVQERTAASGKLSEGVTAQINTQGIISGNFFQYTTHLRRYAYDPDVTFGRNMMKELEAPFGANSHWACCCQQATAIAHPQGS
ncbi:MAG: hypothetical protein IPJ10_12600 [Flavobacteriales bacterium]|nr:hypothetical protein [Flavobacteriales bacterium]